MNELAMTRNFTLPRISSENYTKIGKIVNKYQLNQNNGNDNRRELTDIINSALNSSILPTTGNTLNSNKKEYERRNNINNVKNNSQRSEKIIKGLLGSNEYYKTGSAGLMEKESDNRLGGSKSLYAGYEGLNELSEYAGASGLSEGTTNGLNSSNKIHTGYTTKYRPMDPNKGVKPYDSIWELFKQ